MEFSDSKAPCPACESRAFQRLFEKKDRLFWRCRECGLERIDPPPSLDELRQYYDDSYESGLYSLFLQERQMKQVTAEHRMKHITKYAGSGRLLDLGCANGVLVRSALHAGFDAEGIDLSHVAVEEGRSNGLNLSVSTIEDWNPDYRYQVITGFDILEHVLDPLGFMQDVKRLLEPGGTVVIAVPNTRSVFARVMGKSWWFYIPEEHLTYFHPGAISRLCDRVGLEPIRIERATKPLTLTYGMTQFEEYNPLIYRVVKAASYVLPKSLLDAIIPFYIGEMILIARARALE
jgi:SAM-dependent methyltransferase